MFLILEPPSFNTKAKNFNLFKVCFKHYTLSSNHLKSKLNSLHGSHVTMPSELDGVVLKPVLKRTSKYDVNNSNLKEGELDTKLTESNFDIIDDFSDISDYEDYDQGNN